VINSNSLIISIMISDFVDFLHVGRLAIASEQKVDESKKRPYY